MADTVNTKTNLDGLYKIVYPKGEPDNAIPEQTIMQRQIPFKVTIGEDYKVPVILTLPGGITWGGENASTASGAYDLAQAIAGESKKLAVKGYQMTIREVIGYGAAKAARGGPESFKDALGFVFEGMTLSMRRKLEGEILHGQTYTGIGNLYSAASGSVVVNASTWAPGHFIGCKGQMILGATCSGGAGTIPTSLRTGQAAITAVNYATRTITGPGTSAITSLAANDVLYWGGTKASDGSTAIGQVVIGLVWNSMVGMFQAASITGTVWGQDNTSYEMIRSETKDAGSTDLSFDTLSDAMGQLFVKGCTGDMKCIVSPDTWTNLISPEVALRRHDATYKTGKVEVGSEAIEFHHLTGKLSIIAHPMCKGGEALIYNPDLWLRVGSTDLTFEQDVGANVKKIFLHVANKNGFEVRAYSDQSVFTKRLGYCCLITGIVNS